MYNTNTINKIESEKYRELQEVLENAHKEYGKALVQYALFKINDPSRGQDLVQETFLKTWKYLLRGGNIEMMKSFLYHVLNDLIIDEYRKQKRQVTSLDVMIENGFEQTAGDHGRILNIMDGEKAALQMKHLPEKYRRVLHMRYIQSLTLEEISEKIGQPKNTIAVQVHRGLDKLKSLYENASYRGSFDNAAVA